MKKKITLIIMLICLPFLLMGCDMFTEKEPTDIEKEPTIIEIQNDITEVYEKISSGCVGIYASKSANSGSVGSGVVYKEVDGLYYVVTNQHVIDSATTVRIYRGGSTYYRANVVGEDAQNDIAVLTFSLDLWGGNSIYVHDIFNYEDEIVKVGQTALAIGCPLGLENFNYLSTGVVSRVESSFICTNAEINPGNSGGGLFNLSGRLIGINSEKDVYTTGSIGNSTTDRIPVEGIASAISLSVVLKCIEDIERFGNVTRPAIVGIETTAVNRFINSSSPHISALPNSIDEGLVVTGISSGPAQKAGIQLEDVILSANDKAISNQMDLDDVVNLLLTGDTLVLKVYRSTAQKEVTITFTL